VNSASDEREHLNALLTALDEPDRAAFLPPNDPLLMVVARHHRLTPLLSIRCGQTLPAALAEAFRRDRVVTAARNMILGQAAEECVRAFASAGIAAIVLKGLDFETRLYGRAGSRPTADVDLLVPNDQRRLAFAVLDRLGYEPRAAAPGFDDHDYHEVAWTRAGLEVDLHLALAPFARCRIDYAAIWAEAEPFVLGETPARALSRPHAAIFQALHMAIDHFEVPAIYLIDLMQLLPSVDEAAAARALAHRWHCERPLDTALSLLSRFPQGRLLRAAAGGRSGLAQRIADSYGRTTRLSRPEQLLRKFRHFDTATDALTYFVVQSRRNLGEVMERHLRHRSARERLAVTKSPVS
jgi:hypothetical protein